MIRISWPPKVLSPNSRSHWATTARAKKAYRTEAYLATKAAGYRQTTLEEVYLHVTFMAPDKRKRDDDNLIAAFKAARDGIADALGIDDNRFRITPSFDIGRRPGWVEIRVMEA